MDNVDYKKLSKITKIPLKEILEAVSYDSAKTGIIISTDDAREAFYVLTKLLDTSLSQWNKISLEDLAKADTPNKVWQVYEKSPPGSESNQLSFEKLFLMCNKVEELVFLREEFEPGTEEEIRITQKICKVYEEDEKEEKEVIG